MSLPYRDLHLHTRHSRDCHDDRSTIGNLARWGHEAGVAVGFADHLDARDFSREGTWFREENVAGYMEEFDEARALYPEVTLGVELEYYPDRPDLMALTQDWLDRHRRDLDRVLGSAHFVFGDHAVTWHVHMRQLVGQRTFEEIMEEYVRGEEDMVRSGIADCLAHADVVFRGSAGVFDVEPEVRRRGEEAVLGLCRGAMARGMSIELNLLGVLDGSHRGPSPSWDLVEVLAGEGARIYVGSDAHDSDTFRRGLPTVIEAHERLFPMGAGMCGV